MEYLFHGTNSKINYLYFSSETFFTDDLNTAKNYGSFIYFVEKNKILDYVEKDIFNEHFISKCLLPISIFNYINTL